MEYIVVDLEWNGSYSKRAHGYFNEIIEIGAVRLDERMQIIDTFHATVRPVISKKLSNIVTDLTNITPEELEDGTTFSRLVRDFSRFVGTGETVILTWSTTDLLVMMENCRFFFGRDEVPFLRNYMDCQAYAQKRMGLPAGQQVGLSKAGEMLGISAEEMSLHRALDDSLLTAKILQKVSNPVSLAADVQRVDKEFYRRALFKTTIISDINDPLVRKEEFRFSCPLCGGTLRKKGSWRFRNRAFCAELSCHRCQKEYAGRVQFRRQYDGIECRKKLSEKLPKPDTTEETTSQPVEQPV